MRPSPPYLLRRCKFPDIGVARFAKHFCQQAVLFFWRSPLQSLAQFRDTHGFIPEKVGNNSRIIQACRKGNVHETLPLVAGCRCAHAWRARPAEIALQVTENGWGVRIRTSVSSSKGCRPTTERRPSICARLTTMEYNIRNYAAFRGEECNRLARAMWQLSCILHKSFRRFSSRRFSP